MPLGRSEVKDCERSRHSHPGAAVPRGWHERPGRWSRGEGSAEWAVDTPEPVVLGSAAIQPDEQQQHPSRWCSGTVEVRRLSGRIRIG